MRKLTSFGFRRHRLCSQRSSILVCMIYALYTLGLAAVPMSFALQHQKAPAVQAWLEEEKLTLVRSESGSETFHLTVQVPPNHHAYLDKGDDGLLIPLTFTFTPFEQQGIQVAMLTQPGGKRDEKFRATVLRGKGTFTFELKAIRDALPQDRVLPATLLYQICNDVTEICYPPQELAVPLRLIEP